MPVLAERGTGPMPSPRVPSSRHGAAGGGVVRPLPRAVRAAVFAAVCVLLAATAHLSMSDMAVPVAALVAALAGTAGSAWLLGDRFGPVATGIWAFVAQGALHVVFECTGHASHPGHVVGGMVSAGAGTGHPHHGVHTGNVHMSSAAETAATTGGPGTSTGMFVAHMLAASCCVLLLRHGESVVTAVGIGLGTLVPALSLPAVTSVAWEVPRPVRAASTRRSPAVLLLSHAVVRRGPPGATAT
ncbi:hypothetical protein [Actinomadura sp. 3N407]|uniref:hypothetical protein n=1 Tax=Actinomadura sp. 3N407 TaxID=3457423 RepID=UPI003FCD0114